MKCLNQEYGCFTEFFVQLKFDVFKGCVFLVRVLIVGWYGTETIGDRAILAALLMKFRNAVKEINFTIASIYPFYTQRSYLEDKEFWKKYGGLEQSIIDNIKIIDSRSPIALRRAIEETNYVVMGGGPLDDMASMYMVEYALMLAKRYKKRTMLYGCGLNVLKKKQFQKSAKRIIENSDIVILRDEKSKMLAQKLGVKNFDNIRVSIDPAVFSILKYKEKNGKSFEKKNYIAINLRDFPSIYSVGESQSNDVNEKAFAYLDSVVLPRKSIKLVAMNYFAVGKDDRDILNQYFLKTQAKNIEVVNNPLTMEETFKCFAEADQCIGMRFHAVVIQTILNGNNYILNYTDPTQGKISAFIEQIGGEEFYESRMVHLQNQSECKRLKLTDEIFSYSKSMIDHFDQIYEKGISDLLCIK